MTSHPTPLSLDDLETVVGGAANPDGSLSELIAQNGASGLQGGLPPGSSPTHNGVFGSDAATDHEGTEGGSQTGGTASF